MTTLVTGARGQLGEVIAARFGRHDRVIACSRADLDVTDWRAIARVVHAEQPDVIVNCSAYNAVDAAEEDPAAAFSINSWAVRHLARAAREINACFVHYSTDFVFDGEASAPYTEDAQPNPRGMYATSKLIGEWFAAEVPRHYILRVESLFGGPRAKSTIDRMRQAMLNGEPVRAFVDRTVSPSYVNDVSDATASLLTTGAAPGLYHCVNSGHTNWMELAREIARVIGRPDATIIATHAADAMLPAPRPLYAALSNDKLRRVGIEMPTWQEALSSYLGGRDSFPQKR